MLRLRFAYSFGLFSLLIAAVANAESLPDAAGTKPSTIVSNNAALYSKLCAGCHGPRGVPDQRAAELFKPAPEPFDLLIRSERSAQLGAVAAIIRDGVNAMPSFGSRLSETQIQELAAYVLELGTKSATPR